MMPSFVVEAIREKDEDTGEPLYWSNTDGWVDLSNASTYPIYEVNSVHLPIGGKWTPLPKQG